MSLSKRFNEYFKVKFVVYTFYSSTSFLLVLLQRSHAYRIQLWLSYRNTAALLQ